MDDHNSPTSMPAVRPDPPAPPPIPWRRRARNALRVVWPAAVWIGALIGAAWLYSGLTHRGQALAHETVRELRCSPSVAGRIATLTVGLGDLVVEGQSVATLDARELDARLQLARARLERSRTRIAAVRASLLSKEQDRNAKAESRIADHASEGRRIRARIDGLVATDAADRAERDALTPQIERLQPLAAQGIITPDRLEELLRATTVLETRLGSHGTRIASAREELSAWAELAPAPYVATDESAQLAPHELELETQEARVAELLLERENYVIAAPAAGIVQRISARPGEWVDSGAEIAAVVVAVPDRATAYVLGPHARAVAPGASATLHPRDRAGTPLDGHVLEIGSRIELVPEQLRAIASVPEWGRRVSITIANPEPPLPGEVYTVRFR